jgi:NAD(P)-dependent dehydrogenase (short-subunit alcohol dehydrogenase family)
MPGVLITSANRGLGLEFARQYVADGWFVFAACRDPASGGDLQRLAKSAGGRLTIVAMDVTDSESVRSAARQLKDVVIDIVINSAGITGVSGQKVGKIDYDSWAHVLNVNTMGPLRVIESFVDHIARSERRLVVTITSGMGSIGDNTSGGSIAYPQLQGGGKHGDAKRGYRSCAAPYHLCRGQSRVGEDRHGRPQRDVDATRKCNRLAAA